MSCVADSGPAKWVRGQKPQHDRQWFHSRVSASVRAFLRSRSRTTLAGIRENESRQAVCSTKLKTQLMWKPHCDKAGSATWKGLQGRYQYPNDHGQSPNPTIMNLSIEAPIKPESGLIAHRNAPKANVRSARKCYLF